MASSNDIQDYEVLSILGADLNSTCYKVKHKTTLEVYVWKAISYEKFTESENNSLKLRIEKQQQSNHPNLLGVYDHILNEQMKILYLVCEFCPSGNLSSIVHKCVVDDKYLKEDFLWRILYQIACALKVTKLDVNTISLNSIFLDGNYNVKLFNNELLNRQKNQDHSFAFIMYELCTLQPQRLSNPQLYGSIKEMLSKIPKYYSEELKGIIKFMFNMRFDQDAMIDAILCHPTILLKLINVQRFTTFMQDKKKNTNSKMVAENMANSELEAVYRAKLENIKSREMALKIREEKLAEKSHELHKMERKVALLERAVKDKMLRAEVYLKRCREMKSNSSSGSSIGKMSYENINTSLSADCGDSSINIPTSKKINSQFIKKPPGFIRTMSDRRMVRFKGHSPLKNVCNINISSPLRDNVHNGTSSQPSDCLKKSKSRKKLFSILPPRSRKPLVDLNLQEDVIHEEAEHDISSKQCNSIRSIPVSWTEESKQQAFNLLRLMNQNEVNTIKHTYL